MATANRYRYFAIHKPYGVLSQFSQDHPGQRTLADVCDVPRDVYPIGRLDKDSEGLLLLTNDPRINAQLLDPKQAHPRTYWVQVEGEISTEALQQLATGVSFRIKGKSYRSQRATAKAMPHLRIPEREPPVRFRANIPTSWISLSLIEGKNRQVRRMCAAVGFPVLRLIRVSIGSLQLADLPTGTQREMTSFEEAFR